MMAPMTSPMKPRLLALLPLLLTVVSSAQTGRDANWTSIGGTPQNNHYSPLEQINRSNVSHLQVAWKFDTGEPGGLETTPLILDGVLYGITPSQKIIALDAATGKLLWKFDSSVKGTGPGSRPLLLEGQWQGATPLRWNRKLYLRTRSCDGQSHPRLRAERQNRPP